MTYTNTPNGDPDESTGYYTQPAPGYAAVDQKNRADWNLKESNRIAYDKQRFDEWKKMRDGTIYYDTGACVNGAHIGDINKVSIGVGALYYDETEDGKTYKKTDGSTWNKYDTSYVREVDNNGNPITVENNGTFENKYR